MTRTQKAARNSVFAMLLILVAELSNFAVRTVMVRELGIEYSGVSALFTDILNVLSLTELGFGTAAAYALYKPLHENDQKRIVSLMAYYRKVYLIIAGAITALGLICLPFLGKIVKDVPNIKENIAIVFLLYVAKSVSSYVLVYKATLLDANQQSNIVSIVTVINTLIFTVLEIIALIFFKSFIFYLILLVSSVIIKNLAISLAAKVKFPYLSKQKPDELSKQERTDLRKNVGALSVYKVCDVLQKSVDSIVISIMLGTAAVGYLANYRMVQTNVDSLFGQLLEASLPSVGNLAVSENKDRQYSVYLRLTMLGFLIGNFITVSFFVLIEPFVAVWLGGKYILNIGVAVVLSANLYIMTMARPYESFRTANKLFVEGKYRPIVMTVINIGLSVLFCKYWGIIGVIIATAIARLTTHVWYDPWLINKRVFNRSFTKYLFVKFIAALIVIFDCFITKKLTSFIDMGSPWLNLIICVPICLIVPNLISLLVVFHTKEFKELKVSIMKVLSPFIQKIKKF